MCVSDEGYLTGTEKIYYDTPEPEIKDPNFDFIDWDYRADRKRKKEQIKSHIDKEKIVRQKNQPPRNQTVNIEDNLGSWVNRQNLVRKYKK